MLEPIRNWLTRKAIPFEVVPSGNIRISSKLTCLMLTADHKPLSLIVNLDIPDNIAIIVDMTDENFSNLASTLGHFTKSGAA